jgi:XTP/dITP diphosphohydrolase
VATSNRGKAREFAELLQGEVLTLKDLPESLDLVEDGETFADNALKKAREGLEASAPLGVEVVLADDSGLEVDALDGRPGVYSARYAGNHGDDSANLRKVLGEMKNVPPEKRGAQFRCVLALLCAGKEPVLFEGICRGTLLLEPKGSEGFGYDPIFQPEGYTVSFAEMAPADKHGLSHRGKAVKKLAEYWEHFRRA